MTALTRADVDRIVADARAAGRRANLRGADLGGADLGRADLGRADLGGADLGGADLGGANLRGAISAPAVLQVAGLPSGDAILMPRPDGWELRVGCWTGTPDLLEDLIAGDEGWPEAEGGECARRRPGLQSLIGLCRTWITDHPDAIAAETKRLADFEKAQAERASRAALTTCPSKAGTPRSAPRSTPTT